MKMKKAGTICCAVLLFAATVLGSGCGSTKGAQVASEAANSKTEAASEAEMNPAGAAASVDTELSQKVGISLPAKGGTGSARWSLDGSYLASQFKKAGYQTDVVYADNKSDQQVQDISAMIDEGVSLLIITPVDSTALTDVLSRAEEAAIPVISYDRLIMMSDAVDYYVSFDNYKVGSLMAEYALDQLKIEEATAKDPINIEFASGSMEDNNSQFYFNGAYDTLKPYLDQGTVAVPSGEITLKATATADWLGDTARKRFEDLLSQHYVDGTRLDAVLCANDALAQGVTDAVGATYAGSNDVLITGQDGDEKSLANIVDGKQAMTVYKAEANEALAAFALGQNLLKGLTPEDELVEKSGWDFTCAYDTETYNNGVKVVPSYLLTPVVITKDNYKKELIKTGYYTLDDNGYPKAVG